MVFVDRLDWPGRQIEPESAAEPDGAFHTDLAIHDIDEASADGEPEPGAAKGSRIGAIDLAEFAEKFLAVRFGNPGAGIAHLELQPIAAHRAGDDDGPGGRKLDGIAD